MAVLYLSTKGIVELLWNSYSNVPNLRMLVNLLHTVQTYHPFQLTNVVEFIPLMKKESLLLLKDSLPVCGMHVVYTGRKFTFPVVTRVQDVCEIYSFCVRNYSLLCPTSTRPYDPTTFLGCITLQMSWSYCGERQVILPLVFPKQQYTLHVW